MSVIVPTVDRGLLPTVFCSIAFASVRGDQLQPWRDLRKTVERTLVRVLEGG